MHDREYLCSDDDPGWLEHRRSMITASDVSVLTGNCPWKTEQELVRDKLDPDYSFEPTRNMLWGTLCEGHNMEVFCRALGARYRNINALYRKRGTRLGATIDGLMRVPERVAGGLLPLVSDEDHVRSLMESLSEMPGRLILVEMKQTEAWWKKDWRAGVPRHYMDQVQTQMYVLGIDTSVVVAKIGAADMRAYVVRADTLVQEDIADRVSDFWRIHG